MPFRLKHMYSRAHTGSTFEFIRVNVLLSYESRTKEKKFITYILVDYISNEMKEKELRKEFYIYICKCIFYKFTQRLRCSRILLRLCFFGVSFGRALSDSGVSVCFSSCSVHSENRKGKANNVARTANVHLFRVTK